MQTLSTDQKALLAKQCIAWMIHKTYQVAIIQNIISCNIFWVFFFGGGILRYFVVHVLLYMESINLI